MLIFKFFNLFNIENEKIGKFILLGKEIKIIKVKVKENIGRFFLLDKYEFVMKIYINWIEEYINNIIIIMKIFLL